MDLDLRGRRAVVCGSTQGIGLAAARALAAQGAQILLVSRNADSLERVRADLPGVPSGDHATLAADFADPTALRGAIAAHLESAGRDYQILVNNTGGPRAGPLLDAEPDDFLAAIAMHVGCAQVLVHALLPGMKAARYGRIINVISTSVREPIANLGVSNTTRGAMASWAKTLSREVGPFGITVNNVLPGFTETARLEQLLRGRAQREGVSYEELRENLQQAVPARRFAQPGELGDAIAFLASPAAAYISGVSLPVDGGRLNCI